MTAVEFLIKQIFSEDDKSFFEFYNAEIKRALEMEKQQLKDVYTIPYMLKDDFEQYYNETYKKDKL